MLAKILIGVAVVVALFVAVVATRPSAYHVERKLEIAAPAEVVFGVVNDLRRFAGVLVLFGSPWETADPGMQKTFAGPAAGVGQSFAWSGKEAGKGTMTLAESVPDQAVRIQLRFEEPMESTATFALAIAGAPSGSVVTWSMAGEHNFVGKAFGLFMDLEAMLGADLEKGLERLKAAGERTQPAAPRVTAQ
jgi:Polyketide cyclase / dehydrase and lipid transport